MCTSFPVTLMITRKWNLKNFYILNTLFAGANISPRYLLSPQVSSYNQIYSDWLLQLNYFPNLVNVSDKLGQVLLSFSQVLHSSCCPGACTPSIKGSQLAMIFAPAELSSGHHRHLEGDFTETIATDETWGPVCLRRWVLCCIFKHLVLPAVSKLLACPRHT